MFLQNNGAINKFHVTRRIAERRRGLFWSAKIKRFARDVENDKISVGDRMLRTECE